ncbi:MAG: hypothetical protein OHK0046_05260 [Anaerolineae bacterium]
MREICQRLGISKSSASTWVRDLPLTLEQEAALEARLELNYEARSKGAQTNRRVALERREQSQIEGRMKARENDWLHAAGCMLYWGEGTKSKMGIRLANSDPDLLRFFLRFLRETMKISDERIRIYLNFYLGNGLSQQEIEQY